jgi:hypothetical protein
VPNIESCSNHLKLGHPQSLSSKGKSGTVWTYRYEGAMLRYAKLDRPTTMPTVGTFSKPRLRAAGSPARHLQLLPHQSTLWSGGGHQRQHQKPFFEEVAAVGLYEFLCRAVLSLPCVSAYALETIQGNRVDVAKIGVGVISGAKHMPIPDRAVNDSCLFQPTNLVP